MPSKLFNDDIKDHTQSPVTFERFKIENTSNRYENKHLSSFG